MQFTATILALAVGASAFAPTPVVRSSVAVNNAPGEEPKKGSGGMYDTRDPEPFVNERDKRQSISAAPSFEEYLKSRQ